MKLPLLALALFSLLAASSLAALSDFTRLPGTDVTPCAPPCVRVGGCGNYAPNPNGACNITWLAEQCTATYGCVAFNSNGWLKGCANISCGVSFEGSSVDTYVNTSSGGVPPPPLPCPTAVPVEDEHYPSEEPLEAAGSPPPALLSAGPTWALLRQGGSSVNASVGAWAFGFQLVSTLGSGSLAVLERTFARWGFLVFLSAASGEVARLRKGVGQAQGLVMPVYSYLAEDPCGYYQTVYNNATDYLAARIAADTPDGEATFLAAIQYLPPQRDYASIGAIEPYAKFSVSPDGRIKAADSDIYTTSSAANETGPGVLVFDPAVHLGAGVWPATNWTFTKSALVGGFLRVVAVVGVSYDSGAGFEQLAFAPASEPAASAYIRLRSSLDGEWGAFAYYNASASTPLAPLEEGAFYAALLAESQLWNATLAGAAAYSLPGREGARQVDTATASLVASMSLYVGLQPNYGDGADYWSPQVDRGGSLPFQEIAVVQNLLDIGLAGPAADRLGWWLDNYIKADGQISTGDWEDSCPGGFADGLADYGEMQDIFVRTARAALAQSPNGTAWLAAHMDQGWRLMNYSYHLRLAAVARGEGSGNATKGMIWGSPEHDTCHEPDYYYHNNAWFLRGMLEGGKFLRDVCAVQAVCTALAPQGAVLLAEAERFRADLLASLALSVTFAEDGTPLFIPPIAAPAYHPFASMIESTVAMYSNFRYFAELLGADVLPPAMSAALQDFRETHQGTVSGITRWSDHLDDMPSSYYAAASLRDDRLPRFLMLQYGHQANYMGRGTGTATEQLPINADSNGLYRSYLDGYLEGGIDQCIPSIMLSAIATRWQLVLERYDEDALYLAWGAPRRWYAPATGGFSVVRAATRFGMVGLTVASTAAGSGEDVRAFVSFAPWATMPGVNATPALALRLRGSVPGLAITPSSVTVTGGTLVSVDVARESVLVAVGGATTVVVTASLQ